MKSLLIVSISGLLLVEVLFKGGPYNVRNVRVAISGELPIFSIFFQRMTSLLSNSVYKVSLVNVLKKSN